MEPNIIKSALPSNLSNESYIGKLFQSRDVIHLIHLHPTNPSQLGSGWQHKVLNDFYEEILNFTDTIVETLQGEEGRLLKIIIPSSSSGQDPIEYLKILKQDMLKWRNDCKYEWLKNQLDEVTTLINQTIFKLKFLK